MAVLMVILFHSWTSAGSPKYSWHLANLFSVCFTGVDLFFILSGFLLAQSWMHSGFLSRPQPSLRRYFRRRWFRIAPGYYCALFFWVTLFIPLLTPAALLYSAKGLVIFGLHLSMLITLLPVAGQYNPVWWTIPVECSFYLVLPYAVYLFTGKRLFIGLFLSWLVSFGWMTICLHPPAYLVAGLLAFHRFYLGGLVPLDVIRGSSAGILLNQLPTYAFVFGLGLFLANLYARKELGLARTPFWKTALSQRFGIVYFFVGLFICVLAMNGYGHLISKGKFVSLFAVSAWTSLGFSFVLAGLIFGPKWIGGIFRSRSLRLLGLIGYSAYLWHLPVIFVISRTPYLAALPSSLRFPIILTQAVVVTAILAAFFFLTVEKPFLLASRKSGRPQWQGPVPAPSSAKVL